MTREQQPIDLLLVEDSAGDVRLLKEALRESGLQCALHVAGDGNEALDFVFRKGEHENAPRPNLILLDLNLPQLSGPEVLKAVKGDPETSSIPVIVLSTSSAPSDIAACYSNHAACYITKPNGVDAYFEMMAQLKSFWLDVATLPGVH